MWVWGNSSVAGPVLLQGSRGRRKLIPAAPEGVCRARPCFGPCLPHSFMQAMGLGWVGLQEGVCRQRQPLCVSGVGRALVHPVVTLHCGSPCPL